MAHITKKRIESLTFSRLQRVPAHLSSRFLSLASDFRRKDSASTKLLLMTPHNHMVTGDDLKLEHRIVSVVTKKVLLLMNPN